MSVTLHPSSALGFSRPLTQHVKRTLTITNNNAQPVAFKVKTTAPKLYCVRPNSGRVEPGESVEVQVMLQAMKEEPPLSTKCKDKFLIQSTLITPEKETLPLHDIWNNLDGDTQVNSQKIRVVYLPPEGQTVPEEDEGPAAPILGTAPPPDSRYATVKQHPIGNGHPGEHIPEFEESRNVPPAEAETTAHYEESHEEMPLPGESAPVVNVAVHPPPREPTPLTRAPSRPTDDDVDAKLAEATAEINRLRSLLAAMPEPDASKTTSSPETPPGLRRRHRSPSSDLTTIVSDTDVSSYVEEPLQPDGVPLQIVIVIALGVFVTTYVFF